MDFSLDELSSNKDWMKDIVKHNFEYGVATNQVAMSGPEQSSESGELKALADNLQWSESPDQVEVVVSVPPELPKPAGKHVKVSIGPSHLSVRVLNTSASILKHTIPADGSKIIEYAPNEWVPIADLNLAGVILLDESTWIINGRDIELTLEKASSGKTWGQLTR